MAVVFGLEAMEIVVLVMVSFAGGAFGASIGALPAFCFTGFMVLIGESANILASEIVEATPSAITANEIGVGITGSVAFGPVFGPHVAFAGGVAGAAYASRKGYMESGFDYHNAKDIAFALGTKPDILLVGGVFGVLGMTIRQTSQGIGIPIDPPAAGVILTAIVARLVFGYPLIGKIRGESILDMTPFEREETRGAATDGSEVATDGGVAASERLAVEPWLPHQYRWGNVAMIGLVAGLLGAYIAIETGSLFLAFGISAASLTFLNLGVENFPVTHHMTLPASYVGHIAVFGMGAAVPVAIVAGAVFGIIGALLGEVVERVFYAHADTHFDPPAASIILTTLLIGSLALAGVFPNSAAVPLP